jgi:DNA-binding NarL/FixJ family response regulator
MGEESAFRVLIADDHPLMVGGLRQAVLAAAPDAAITVAHDFDSMVAALDASPDTDLVLLDLAMPGVRGFSGLLFLRSQRPSTPIIVVSGNEERAVIRHCMEFGAAGFIPKTNSLDTMRAAIAQVLDGGRWTPPDFDLSSAPNGQSSAMARRLASLTPQQIRGLDDAVARPAKQADCLRARRVRSDRESACVRDLPEVGRREPDSGRHSRDQNRDGAGIAHRIVEREAGAEPSPSLLCM